MIMMPGALFIRLFFFLLGILLSTSVSAHPHNWIEVQTRFILDKESNLTQIKTVWEFDAFYSMMTLADAMNEYGNEAIGLKATAEDMIKNLRSYDYFSSLKIDGKNIPIPKPRKYKLSSKPGKDEPVLVLEMTFDIKPSKAIENKSITWQVFDPTYFIAMMHLNEKNIEIIGGNATECSKVLEIPEPTDEIIEYAQSLDRTQKNTDGLGLRFAEKTLIVCK